MMLLDQHYSWAGMESDLTAILCDILPAGLPAPYVLCIGTDRHILDCLGPLTGSMIKDQMPKVPLYGTLHNPLHAHNLSAQLNYIRYLHSGGNELVIDASLGGLDELGRIRLRSGSIYPGKAIGKKLPLLGTYAITGVVKSKEPVRLIHGKAGKESLSVVYDMARIISSAIVKWYGCITAA